MTSNSEVYNDDFLEALKLSHALTLERQTKDFYNASKVIQVNYKFYRINGAFHFVDEMEKLAKEINKKFDVESNAYYLTIGYNDALRIKSNNSNSFYSELNTPIEVIAFGKSRAISHTNTSSFFDLSIKEYKRRYNDFCIENKDLEYYTKLIFDFNIYLMSKFYNRSQYSVLRGTFKKSTAMTDKYEKLIKKTWN